MLLYMYTQSSCLLYDLLNFSRLEALSSAKYKAKSGLSFHVSENHKAICQQIVYFYGKFC